MVSLIKNFEIDIPVYNENSDIDDENDKAPESPKHPPAKTIFIYNKKEIKKEPSPPKFKPIYVKPVKEDSYFDPRFKNLPIQMPKPPFSLLFVGQCRSGKSVLLMNFIYDEDFGYINKFDEVIFISPSIGADGSLSKLNDDKKIRKISSPEELQNINQIINDIYQKKLEEAEEDKNDKKKIRRNTLLILDDIVGILGKSKAFEALSTKYRQPLISIICTTQMFRKIPATMRENVSGVCIFPCYDKKEVKKYVEEYSAKYKDFESKYYKATSEKYSFLFANLRENKLYKRFEEDIT